MSDCLLRLALRTVACPRMVDKYGFCHCKGEGRDNRCDTCDDTREILDPRFDGLRRECQCTCHSEPEAAETARVYAHTTDVPPGYAPTGCVGYECPGWVLVPDAEAGDALMVVAVECIGDVHLSIRDSKYYAVVGNIEELGYTSDAWPDALAAAIEAAIGADGYKAARGAVPNTSDELPEETIRRLRGG